MAARKKKAAKKRRAKPSAKARPAPKGGARKKKAPKKRAARKKKATGKASRKRPARSGGQGNKPPAPGAPNGLKRGTAPYRHWEAGQILALWSIGATKAVIVERLGISREEWEHRLRLIQTTATTGDALLVWARFAESCQRRLADCERILKIAREGTWEAVTDPQGHPTGVKRCIQPPNPNAAIGAVRTQHDVEKSLVDTAVRLGIVRALAQPPGDPDFGRAAEDGPALSVHANFFVQILEAAGESADLTTLTEADLVRAVAKLGGEFRALADRPGAPSLTAGGS